MKGGGFFLPFACFDITFAVALRKILHFPRTGYILFHRYFFWRRLSCFWQSVCNLVPMVFMDKISVIMIMATVFKPAAIAGISARRKGEAHSGFV